MNWAYIAGFFDGEGSITRNGRGFRVTIPQTNLIVLEKIERWTGYGHIRKTLTRRPHWKKSWTYAISKQTDVLSFLQRVKPWVIVKRPIVTNVVPQLVKLVQTQRVEANQSIQRRHLIKKLRRRNLTYRAIGKMVGLDWGYVRRVVLSGRK